MVYYVFKLSPITHHTAILYTRSGVSFEVLKFRLEAERHPSRRLDARSPWLLNTLQGQEGQDGEEKIKSVLNEQIITSDLDMYQPSMSSSGQDVSLTHSRSWVQSPPSIVFCFGMSPFVSHFSFSVFSFF